MSPSLSSMPFLFISRMYFLLWLAILSAKDIQAQTFADFPIPIQQVRASTACKTARNTTLACASVLAINSLDFPRLAAADLTTLCQPTCLSSLERTRATIATTCTLPTDTITVQDVVYPATYLIDLFTYAYKLFCRVDSTTNQYCDVLQIEWQEANSFTTAQRCSDCALGQLQLQLNSTFGYDPDVASDFKNLTSSCSKTGYGFTTPAPYAVTTTVTIPGEVTTPPPISSSVNLPSSCVSVYKIKSQDTCDSIASSHNVSTYAIYGPNGLNCDELPVGKSLCLLGSCQTYKVKQGDTCDSIITGSQKSISPELLVAWNPNVNPLCTNIESLTDQLICLSRPEGIVNPDASVPTTSVKPVPTAIPTRTYSAETQLPTASGTITGCLKFRNYQDLLAKKNQLVDLYPGSQIRFSSLLSNDCEYIVSANSITSQDFLTWNPILKPLQKCALIKGFSYCVDHPSKTSPVTSGPRCWNGVDPATVPSGTISSCKCYKEYPGHFKDAYECSDIAREFNVTIEDLKLWNPWLGLSCDLFVNMPDPGSVRGICVGLTGRTTSTSASLSTSRSTSISTILSSSTSSRLSSSSISSTSTSSRVISSITTSSIGTTTITSSIRPSSTSSRITTPTTTTATSSIRSVSSSSQTTIFASTTVISSATSTSSSSVCVWGLGAGNYEGLCRFCCSYGYCPPGPCTCLAYGEQVPIPAPNFPVGYPAPGLDNSYLGLCNFACLRDYCPPEACTRTPP